jgi:predicted dehydrogenase
MAAAALRAGLIGCGFFGRIQAEAWRRLDGVQLVAACDPLLERAQSLASRAYPTAEEMIERERLDFLDIAAGPESHLPLVRLAAAHGLPVICQKPMAPSWAEALAMVQAAEAAGVRLIIHENWRWQPWFRAAKSHIERGDIGRPLAYLFRVRRNDGRPPAPYPHQPYFRRMPRLLIYETLVHQVDTARFLFGDPAAVYAQARRLNPQIAGEDQALLVLTHPGGLPGVIDGHRYLDLAPDSPLMGEAIFEGEQGALRISPEGDLWLDGRCLWRNQIRQGYRGDSVFAAQQHFLNCLVRGAPCESEARRYLTTFGAVEAAYRSLAEGRAVRLEEILPCE